MAILKLQTQNKIFFNLIHLLMTTDNWNRECQKCCGGSESRGKWSSASISQGDWRFGIEGEGKLQSNTEEMAPNCSRSCCCYATELLRKCAETIFRWGVHSHNWDSRGIADGWKAGKAFGPNGSWRLCWVWWWRQSNRTRDGSIWGWINHIAPLAKMDSWEVEERERLSPTSKRDRSKSSLLSINFPCKLIKAFRPK